MTEPKDQWQQPAPHPMQQPVDATAAGDGTEAMEPARLAPVADAEPVGDSGTVALATPQQTTAVLQQTVPAQAEATSASWNAAMPVAGPGVPVASPHGSWQPGPYPQPQLPRRYGISVVVIVAVVTGLLCGIGGVVAGIIGAEANKLRSTAAKSTPAAIATGPTHTGDGTALLAHIPPPPPDATVRVETGTTGGVMDLDQYVSKFFSTSSIEKDLLQARGFEVAAIKAYTLHGTTVSTHLVQFDAADGAQSFILGQMTARTRDSRTTDSFDLPGVDVGRGFEFGNLDTRGNRACYLLAAVGNIAVLIEVFTPGKLDRAANLRVMAGQVAALQ